MMSDMDLESREPGLETLIYQFLVVDFQQITSLSFGVCNLKRQKKLDLRIRIVEKIKRNKSC